MQFRYFFESDTIQARLLAVARKWIDTPFHGHAAVRGVGVDCVHLVAEIYKEVGVISDFNPPPYTMDGGQHDSSSKVIEYIERTGRFEKVWRGKALPRLANPRSDLPPIQTGDLLCFNLGRVEYHVGLALFPDRFLQCYQLHPVAVFSLQDSTWANRLTAIYRPINQ